MIKSARATGMPGRFGNGVVTLLLSPDPFSAADVATLTREIERLGFEFVLTPTFAEQPEYEQILGKSDPASLYRSYPLDISPPTDDRPFFFQMLRLRDVLNPLANNLFDLNRPNLEAIRLLVLMLAIVTVLSVSCIIVPLAVATPARVLLGQTGLLGYFV